MGFSGAEIQKISNGYVMRVDWTMSHDKTFYKTKEELLKALEKWID